MANGAGGCVRGLDPQQPWSDCTRGQYPGPRDICPQSIVRVTLSWVGPPADVSAELTAPHPMPTTSLKTTLLGRPSPRGPMGPPKASSTGEDAGRSPLPSCFCESEPAAPNDRMWSSLGVLSIKSQKCQCLCNVQNGFFRPSGC